MSSALFASGPSTPALALHSTSRAETLKQKRKECGPWLHSWYDPVANLRAFSSCMRLVDLDSDGDYKLLVAGRDQKLRVFRGNKLITEQSLLEPPCAIAAFYPDRAAPQRPSVAIGCGSSIYIYRNLRPYFKFTLPAADIEPIESKIWEELKSGQIDAAKATDILNDASIKGLQLTTRSRNYLSLQSTEERQEFVDRHKNVNLVQTTLLTCMDTIHKSLEEERAVSCLVIGTEDKQVFIMDPSGTKIATKISVPGVPAFLAVSGTLDVEYRIVAACRNGAIYSLKKGKVVGSPIELETQICGLCMSDKNLIVSGMNSDIHCFSIKGKKSYSLYMPAPIVDIAPLNLKRAQSFQLLVVALTNGEVRLHNQKNLIYTLKLDDPVAGLRLGPFIREDAAMILCHKSGALTIKLLQRQAQLDGLPSNTGPPPEQDVLLNVPKKTKVYVEQTQREKDQAIDIHRAFQKDLCKLRLTTARAYVKLMMDGQGPLSMNNGSVLRLDVQVQGLGPQFKLKVAMKNAGTTPISNVPITCTYNHAIYRLTKSTFQVPLLLPLLSYQVDIPVECIDENGAADPIRIFICNPRSTVPVIAAIVNMPVSQVNDMS